MNIINSNISLLQQITNYPIISISNRHKLHNIKLQKQNILFKPMPQPILQPKPTFYSNLELGDINRKVGDHRLYASKCAELQSLVNLAPLYTSGQKSIHELKRMAEKWAYILDNKYKDPNWEANKLETPFGPNRMEKCRGIYISGLTNYEMATHYPEYFKTENDIGIYNISKSVGKMIQLNPNAINSNYGKILALGTLKAKFPKKKCIENAQHYYNVFKEHGFDPSLFKGF